MKTWKQIYTVGITKAYAEIKEGVVTRKTYNGNILEIFIDTDPSTPGAEHVIRIPSIRTTDGMTIDEFVVEGSIIKFDDERGQPYGRYKITTYDSFISIDGMNIIDLIGRTNRTTNFFRYADKTTSQGNG